MNTISALLTYMAKSDFFLSPRLKLPLQGSPFDSIEAIKENKPKEFSTVRQWLIKKYVKDWVERVTLYYENKRRGLL